MPNNAPALSFLESFILQKLTEFGFNELSEKNQQELLPQFVAQAEIRLGAALLPLLSLPAAEQFALFLKNEKTTGKQWEQFWRSNVPQFDLMVAKILQEFAEEMKAALL